MKEKNGAKDLGIKRFMYIIQTGILLSLYFILCVVEIILLISLYYNSFFSMLLSIIVGLYFLDFVFILKCKTKTIPMIIFAILCAVGCWIDFVVCFYITIVPLIIVIILKLILNKITR